MKNKRLCGDNSTNMQGMIMVIGFALPLIDIYLYIKFYLNANRSFKVICWTKSRGRTKRWLTLWGA